MTLPETKTTPHDTGNEEKARMEADGWEEWFMLHKRGYPSSMLWVRWAKPPKPSLAEAMGELREVRRGAGRQWNLEDLLRAAAKVLDAYDAQAEDRTRDLHARRQPALDQLAGDRERLLLAGDGGLHLEVHGLTPPQAPSHRDLSGPGSAAPARCRRRWREHRPAPGPGSRRPRAALAAPRARPASGGSAAAAPPT